MELDVGASFRAGKAAAGLLPTLTETLPRWFEATRHSSFLYVASELIKVFGSNPDLAPELGVAPWLPSPCHPVMIIRYHAADNCKCLIGSVSVCQLVQEFLLISSDMQIQADQFRKTGPLSQERG
jgi:hypothetical protein